MNWCIPRAESRTRSSCAALAAAYQTRELVNHRSGQEHESLLAPRGREDRLPMHVPDRQRNSDPDRYKVLLRGHFVHFDDLFALSSEARPPRFIEEDERTALGVKQKQTPALP